MMKLFSGLALASASLLSFAAHAAAPDPAPTLATDAQGTTLTGAHHLDGAAFSLIVTDWWLSGTIAKGQAQDVRLIVEVHLPQYPLLDRATDAAGRKLDVVILRRGPSARWRMKASERVAIVLPRDLAEKARTAGLAITVSGKDRSFPISVPADALARFLDAYAQAAAGAHAAPAPATPAPAPAQPVSTAAAPAPQSAPSAPPPPAVPEPLPATPPAAAPVPQPQMPAVAVPAPRPDDDDPAITPVPDTRVRLPDGSFAPDQAPVAAPPAPLPAGPPPAAEPPSPAPLDRQASPPESGGGHGIWVDSLGLQFVATSSGAMVLMNRPGSIAASKGIEGGDFIEAVDGVPIKTLTAREMAAKIGAPGVKVLHMIAAGDVKVR
ncbi:hypothetical protein [Sphingomonas oryzagri]